MPAPTDRIDDLNSSFEGKYRIDRELGSGGTATVYLAEDLKHHRRVAIKVLRDDLSASVGTERFLREIEIAAHLQHPNILPLLDSGEAGGRLFYVMPFVEGQSLRDRLAREHELPVGEAVRLIVEVVDALAYAHARGVVHRDVKPDNVMLSGRHALIADFGVARAISSATNPSQITSLGVALGTPSYMSPEQATADPSVDHRTDIYAVGVLAYELIAGTVPFVGVSPQKVLSAHVMESPAPLSKHRSGIAPALEQAVMQCLAKKPADRWQRADDLLAALEPLATPTAGLAPTSARLEPVRASRPRLVPLAIATLVIVGGAVIYQSTRHSGPSLALGASSQLTTEAGLQIHPALSPDGKLVAYAAGTSRRMRIFIQPLGGGRVIPLSDDTTALQYDPRWSSDGTQLLTLTNGGV
ncbi:MAG: protein kinase domain-containing protein, partial [Gemmatimonadaceae bacterium]